MTLYTMSSWSPIILQSLGISVAHAALIASLNSIAGWCGAMVITRCMDKYGLRAMAVPMEDHRSPIFPELTRTVLSGLKPIFKTTTGTPILFPSSGTGCWEAALTNCLNPGDKVLVSRFGQFSHLWVDMCQRLGFEVLGFEPSVNHARVATQHFQLPIVNDYFTADRVAGKKFDQV